MRKNKQLILAVLIAGALVGLAWSSGLSRVEEKTVRLVAAARDIPAGSALSEDQLILVECPAELALAGYAQSVSEAAGLWTGQGFAAGELISPRSLAAKASGLVYPDAGAGRRLVTISLAAAAANGFWLEAGNRVDIYLVPRSRENSLGIQVMENIRILAVLRGDGGQDTAVKSTASPLLCLDLDSAQAAAIFGAYGVYDLQLAVINEGPGG
jgi:Flp pilus assembly protein CpaB